jgi:hypothetical protein
MARRGIDQADGDDQGQEKPVVNQAEAPASITWVFALEATGWG